MKVCSVCQRCYEDTIQTCEADHGSLFPIRSGSRLMCADYRLDVLLEHTPQSETYRAAHVVSNQSFVVKIYNLNAADEATETLRRTLQTEAQSAARASHPNLASVYESGLLDGADFYTVAEPVEGLTLRDYLTNCGGSLPEAEAVHIARQTAEALEAAHRVGIVHRHVNPSNIVVSFGEADQPFVKLRNFDFGAVEQCGAVASVSAAQMPFEAFRYLSPEQFATQPANARTDVYSLGVVLYEMLCGAYPYHAPSQAAIHSEPINEKPFENLRYDARALLAYLLKQSMQKSPAARLPSAANFARQLRQIEQLIQPPIGMRPTPPRVLPDVNAAAANANVAVASANAAENIFSPVTDESPLKNFQPSNQFVTDNNANLSATIPSAEFSIEPPVEEVKISWFNESTAASEPEPIDAIPEHPNVESFAAEPILVQRKAAVEAAFASEPILVTKRQTIAAPFTVEPIRVVRKETVVRAVEPETAAPPIINLEEARQSTAPHASIGYLNQEAKPSRQYIPNRRPMFAAAGLLGLLAALGLGMFLYNQRQNLAEPTIASATPVPHASPLAEPISAAVVEDAPEAEPDSETVEEYAPVINDMPTATHAKRANQTESSEVGRVDDSIAVSNAPIKNQPAFQRTANDQPAAERQSGVTVKSGAEQNELNASLDEWIAATNKRDIEAQMNHYAPKVDAYYRTRNVSPEAVRAEKRRIFERAREVDIQTGAPSINVSADGRTATMRFRKKYAIKEAERNRTGEVIQELRWVKSGKGWKIVSERDVKVINR